MMVSSPHEDLIVGEVLAALGPWSKQVVIGGGFAPIIYRLYLATGSVGKSPVGTRDVDTLIPRKIPHAPPRDISQHLTSAGFNLRFKDISIPATEAYAKVVDGEEIEIEFLTDDSIRTDKEKNVTIAGVTAQPLSYLKMSLARPLEFVSSNGLAGLVVTPSAWIFHKGLTFPRRSNPSKRLKDLYGIWYVTTQLGNLSEVALTDFEKLRLQRTTWFSTFKENLESFVISASDAELRNLEQQDPHGVLKSLGFKAMCRILGCEI